MACSACPAKNKGLNSCENSLYQILQILSVTLFEKTPILQALQPFDSQEPFVDPANQLNLFDL